VHKSTYEKTHTQTWYTEKWIEISKQNIVRLSIDVSCSLNKLSSQNEVRQRYCDVS